MRSSNLVVTLEISMPGTYHFAVIGKSNFISWLYLDDDSNCYSADYSIFGLTAPQSPERSPYLSQLNQVLVQPLSSFSTRAAFLSE
jgi:hypothetical protein